MRRLLLAAVMATTIACGGARESTTQQAPPLRPVSLPDVSSASADVQAQLRERFASLSKTINDASASSQARADAYGAMGKVFMAAEYFDAAEACFVNAETLAPSDMKWPYYLGHTFRYRNNTAQAQASFERALLRQPNYLPTLVWLAEMHLAANRPDEAEKLLITAQSIDAKSAAVMYGRGRASLARKDYQAAVTYLEQALSIAPAATRIHYPLGMAYRGLGNRKMAETHLQQRGDVDLPPSDPLLAELSGLLQNAAAYQTRGVQAMEARQWPEAIANLRKAIELAPEDAFTRLNLATSLYLSGKPDDALAEYRAAIAVSPGLAKAHFGAGVILENRGQDREAIDAFQQAVRADPGYIEAHYSLADALRRTGRVNDSLTEYAEVLRLNPAVSQASFGYAMGLVRLGRYHEARDRFERDLKAFPDQAGFAHALARLLAAAPDDRVRDGGRALSLLRPLIESQRTVALEETMAMAMAEAGRFDDAVMWQRQAMGDARASGRADVSARLDANLRLYEGRRPCRTPWTNDDPVHHPRPSAN